ncbi:MAG: lysylphosphatidylglycerol synthase transmembrane domain-containing protein [Parcubacteria group bacterium]
MKKTLLFILSLLVGVALFIGVLYRIGIHEILDTLRSFSWATLALVVAVGFLQLTVVLYRWQMILRTQGDHVPLKKLFAPKLIGYAVSFITPGPYVGGEPVQAYVLKKETGVRFTHGLAAIIVDKLLDFTYPLPFLIGALVYVMTKFDVSSEVFTLFALVLFALIVVLALFYIMTYQGKGFISVLLIAFRVNKAPFIKKYFDKLLYFEKLIIQFFQHRGGVFVKGLLLSLLSGALVFIQLFLLLYGMGIMADPWHIFIIMVFMILAFIMPIPGALGTMEAGQALVFNALSYSASAGVVFAFIFRIIELTKVGLGLIFLSSVGLQFLRNLNDLSNGQTNEKD